LLKCISENEAVANDIKAGDQGKAGILVGKVLGIIGKGANGKVIRQIILDKLGAAAVLEKEQASEKVSKEISVGTGCRE
jgi:aspartyl-tRNA synthetase